MTPMAEEELGAVPPLPQLPLQMDVAITAAHDLRRSIFVGAQCWQK
jgi:hypothetical protein